MIDVKSKVSVDLAGLTLSDRAMAARWVEVPKLRRDDESEAVQTLTAAGLDDTMLEKLRCRLALEHNSHVQDQDQPTAGSSRKSVSAAADLAGALATVFDSSSTTAKAEMSVAVFSAFGRNFNRSAFTKKIKLLAQALRERVDQMPLQSRHAPRVGIVRALDEIAGHVLPAPTTSQTSPYYKACRAAFVLAGYPFSPDKAIFAYVKRQGQIGGLTVAS